VDRFDKLAHKVLIDMDLLPGRKLELLAAALRDVYTRPEVYRDKEAARISEGR